MGGMLKAVKASELSSEELGLLLGEQYEEINNATRNIAMITNELDKRKKSKEPNKKEVSDGG